MTTDKQITIDVPEERVAEFYASFARFLAGHRGPSGYRHGGRCGRRRPHGEGGRRRTGERAA